MSLYYGYKDDHLPLSLGSIDGNIDMSTYKISQSSAPTNNHHLANKKYVDDKSGLSGNADGDFDMQSHKITNLRNPVNNNNAVSKIYMTNYLNSYINSILIEHVVTEYYRKPECIYRFTYGYQKLKCQVEEMLK